MGCEAAKFCRHVPLFRDNLLPYSSIFYNREEIIRCLLWYLCTKLHGVRSQNTVILTVNLLSERSVEKYNLFSFVAALFCNFLSA